ncbi:MAG: hypothetical protein WED09_05405 [Homoserinimonas sp.]
MPEFLGTVVQSSAMAHDAIRGLAAASTFRELPLPVVGEILENLEGASNGLPKVLDNLGESLVFFLAADFQPWVTEGDDQREHIAIAQTHLHLAASLAVQLGRELSNAKSAIAGVNPEASML